MCLACHGAQYACRNRLQFYVATYMHITNLRALGKKHQNLQCLLVSVVAASTYFNASAVSKGFCKCVWLAMERSMLAAIGFNCMLQHTCTWLIKSIRQKHQNHCNACLWALLQHQLTSAHRHKPRVSVNVFGLPWSAVCLPQSAFVNLHMTSLYWIKSIRQKTSKSLQCPLVSVVATSTYISELA